jgi:hypothetical protein
MSKPADDPVLQAALGKAKAIPYVRNAFRAMPGGSVIHNLRFEHLWAGNSAGRCNPDGIARLYLSVEKETAQAEFDYYASKSGQDPALAECHSYAVEVKLARVLDLRSHMTRKLLGITLVEIQADWETDPLLPPSPPTRLQAIGYWISEGHGKFSGNPISGKTST